jgi:hypothetical protein
LKTLRPATFDGVSQEESAQQIAKVEGGKSMFDQQTATKSDLMQAASVGDI